MSELTAVYLQCHMCGERSAKFTCCLCQKPMCEAHQRTSWLPYPHSTLRVPGLQYCQRCHRRRFLERLWQHHQLNPFPLLLESRFKRLKQIRYWWKRL